MKKFNFHYFPRDFEAGDFIENFLVATVSSILVIRLFLYLSNWPKIQTGDFYIQHMLFGGFIMMFSLIALLVFLNREAKVIASVTGGIGFGAFIDELGKFITHDNDYFYQPTVALIYVILVLIFLTARAFEKYFKLTEQEYAVNALEVAKNAITHDLDKEEKQRALYLLKHAPPDDHVSNMLAIALADTRAISTGKPNVFHIIKDNFKNLYLSLIRSKYFVRLIVGFFIILSLINFLGAIFNFRNIESFADWGQLFFSMISGLIVLIGIWFLRYKKSRRKAYLMFKLSVLISIFLTQFFRFLENQFNAIASLLLMLVVLSVLQYLIYEESLLKAKKVVRKNR